MDFYLMIPEQKVDMVVIQCRINRSWKRSVCPCVTHFHYICSNVDNFSNLRNLDEFLNFTCPLFIIIIISNKPSVFGFFSKSSSSKYLFPLFCSSMSLVWFTLLRMTRWGRYRFQTTWQKLMKLASSVTTAHLPRDMMYS